MGVRDQLLAALLDDPADAVTVLATADWHEENGLAGQASLLRLSLSLRSVPWPEKYHPCFRVVPQRWGQHRGEPVLTHQVGYSDVGCVDVPDVRVPDKWPNCERWNGVGRIPGFAAAYRLLDHPDCLLRTAKDVSVLHRMVCRYELYACGVMSRRERDEEYSDDNKMLFDLWPGANEIVATEWDGLPDDLVAMWSLRGGRAGEAMNLMIRHEQACCRKHGVNQKRPLTVAARRRQQELRSHDWAMARTYHRDVVRTFLAAEPWRVAFSIRDEHHATSAKGRRK